jgi:hypothetical protein
MTSRPSAASAYRRFTGSRDDVYRPRRVAPRAAIEIRKPADDVVPILIDGNAPAVVADRHAFVIIPAENVWLKPVGPQGYAGAAERE